MSSEANPAFSMSAFAEFFALQNALLGVPVFDGKTPDLRTFVQDLETAELKVPAALKNEFIKNVIARLRDSARDSVEGKTFDSIAGLVSHLKEALSPAVRDFEAYFAELSRAKMERNETVAEFGSRLQTIVRFAKAALLASVPKEDVAAVTNMVGKTALKTFLKGLRPDIELRVSFKNPSTLDAAIDLARQYSQYLQDAAEHRGEFHQYTRREDPPFAHATTQNQHRYSQPQVRFPPQNASQVENGPFLLKRKNNSFNPQNPQTFGYHGHHQHNRQVTRTMRVSDCPPQSDSQTFQASDVCTGGGDDLITIVPGPGPSHCPNCLYDLASLDWRPPSQQGIIHNDTENPVVEGERKVEHLNSLSARLRVVPASANPRPKNQLVSAKFKAGNIPKRY